MRIVPLLPLLLLAACTDGPTKQESVRIFAAANTAMTTAQQKAVDAAKGVAPIVDLELDYSGPCSLGGTVSVKGNYDGEGNDEHAEFDLNASFNGCQEPTGTLGGSIHWKSVAGSGMFSASMDGVIDWSDSQGSASCDLDLRLDVTQTSVHYKGSLCGYDVGELTLGQ